MALLIALIALYILGRAGRWSTPWRIGSIGALLLVAIVTHGVLPDGHPLRVILGGDARGAWFVLLIGGAAVLYRRGLRALRNRVTPDPEPAREDRSHLRTARHILLHEIGGPGQARLGAARVLVVGAGGLGNPVLAYLGAAGVGQITIVDDDHVDLSNLHRQVMFTPADLGAHKARIAADRLAAQNPDIRVSARLRRLDADLAGELIPHHDLVIDGTDNAATRALINAACVAAQVPLIWGGISAWDGQVTLFDPARGGPCLACLFPADEAGPSCTDGGVIGPLPGVIGSIMALEAVKHLAQAGQGLRGQMMLYDGLYARTRILATSPRAECAICAAPLVPAQAED